MSIIKAETATIVDLLSRIKKLPQKIRRNFVKYY